eukprot:s713_g16.t1
MRTWKRGLWRRHEFTTRLVPRVLTSPRSHASARVRRQKSPDDSLLSQKDVPHMSEEASPWRTRRASQRQRTTFLRRSSTTSHQRYKSPPPIFRDVRMSKESLESLDLRTSRKISSVTCYGADEKLDCFLQGSVVITICGMQAVITMGMQADRDHHGAL